MLDENISQSSLKFMLHAGGTLRAFCSNAQACLHNADLPIDMLIARLGVDFDIVAQRYEIRRRLICTRCATRFPTFIIGTGQVKPITQASGLHPMTGMNMDETIEAHRRFRAEVRARECK